MSATSPGCLLVRAGSRRLGLPLELVVEVIEPGEFLPVPSRERALCGVVNQRGRLVPVFVLEELVSVGEGGEGGVGGDKYAGGARGVDRGTDGALVLADVGGVRVGYLVDEALVVMRSGMTYLPADESLPWARAIVGIPDEGYVPLVDLALLRAEPEGA